MELYLNFIKSKRVEKKIYCVYKAFCGTCIMMEERVNGRYFFFLNDVKWFQSQKKNVTLAFLGCVGNAKYQSNNGNDKTI